MESNKSKPASIWKDAVMNLIYTLSPTHCGIGQTAASVDLPIARDAVTGFPFLPATALKGVAREAFETHDRYKDSIFKDLVTALFGPELDEQETQAGQSAALSASGLAFTEGRLVAYPVRALSRPFFHVTCPLILDNLARDARLLGSFGLEIPDIPSDRVVVADAALDGRSLVLEDLCYKGKEVSHDSGVEQFAGQLGRMLPDVESAAARRLESGLVILPDAEFCDLMQRAVPVVARTRLTKGKTADKWKNPDTDRIESGSLWYEEHLPADTLFISFTGHRRQVFMHNTRENRQAVVTDPLKELTEFWKSVPMVQIGGNETIGYGFSLWEILNGKGGR